MSGAVKNRTYRAWGKYRVTELFSETSFMVVYRINETLQTGAVCNRTYRAGETVYLFLKFTIVCERGLRNALLRTNG